MFFIFQFKSNLYHMVKCLATPAAVEKIDNTSFQFIDCVTQVLKATKLLTYAWFTYAWRPYNVIYLCLKTAGP